MKNFVFEEHYTQHLCAKSGAHLNLDVEGECPPALSSPMAMYMHLVIEKIKHIMLVYIHKYDESTSVLLDSFPLTFCISRAWQV